MRTITIAMATALLAGSPAIVRAAPSLFIGTDDGVSAYDPFPNARAAADAFHAAASLFGPVRTENFESAPIGFHPQMDFDGLAIAISGPDVGPGISGVSDIDRGSYYGFNTTAGGSKWLGFPSAGQSEAIIRFAAPTNSFGFFATGLQSAFTTSLAVTLLDGSQLSFALPVNDFGGATWFGLVDSIGFTSVAVRQDSYPGFIDAWGIDDISFNTAAPAVPEPATWAMLVCGFGIIGGTARRRRNPAIA